MSNDSASTIDRRSGANWPLLLLVLSVISGGTACIGVLAFRYFPVFLAIGLAVPVAALGLYWLLKSPYRCMYALIVALPLEATAVLEVGFTLRIAYVFIILCAACTWLLYRRRTVPNNPAVVPMAIYLLISTLSLIQIVLYPPPPVYGLLSALEVRASGLRYFVQLFMLFLHGVLFLNVLSLFRDKAHIKMAIRIYVIVAVIVGLYSLYQPVAIAYNLPLKAITNSINTGATGYGGIPYATSAVVNVRPRATFQEPGNLGHYLLTALAILLVYNPFMGRRAKLFHYLSIAVLTWGIIVTVARGTYVGLGLVVLFLLVTRLRRESLHNIGAMICSLFVFGGVLFPVIGTRKSSDVSFMFMLLGRFSMSDASTSERTDLFPALLKVWMKHPILGVGMGAYGSWGSAELKLGTILSACGVWWAVLVETGILGFLAYAWFVFAVLKHLYCSTIQCKDPELKQIGAGLLVAVGGALSQYLFFADRMSTYVWFLLGLATAVTCLMTKKSSPAPVTVAGGDVDEQ